MKKGVEFKCGHGPDPRGTPFQTCLECRKPDQLAILRWNIRKAVDDKIARGKVPF